MNRDESRTVYELAREHVEQLQRQLGNGFGERLVAGLTRAERSAANKASHQRAQLERAATQRPTLRQKQLLWALGYRGPVPENRAEVAALVDELQAEADRRALAPSRVNRPHVRRYGSGAVVVAVVER